MTGPPSLKISTPDGETRAIALVLHGGRSKSLRPVRPEQLAVLRMLPFARSLRRGGTGVGLAVAQLHFRVRGWNGALQSPVPDVRWALDELGERFPGVPAALVGHSMGGRAAFYAAGHPSVRAVVGLAPWIEPGDLYAQLGGRRILIAHGDLDRMTSAPASAAYARAAAQVAESVSYVSVRAGRHAMLRRAGVWHGLATGYVLSVMCDEPPQETVDAAAANVVSRALAGEASLVV